jgi:photosystem II stability/assembly factor-like uncharacterized protein
MSFRRDTLRLKYRGEGAPPMRLSDTSRTQPALYLYCVILATLSIYFPASTSAQWDIQTAPTTADLRGIDNVGKGIAWASGTEGTVLRTTNDGKDWQRCVTPPDAEHLDFRGIQAFDANTAIVMSSGKGSLSRLYKTTDACQSWTLLFTNPDPEGFWDALQFSDRSSGYILGDPVNGEMAVWNGHEGRANWTWNRLEGLEVSSDIQAFAASNSGLMIDEPLFVAAFVTGGSQPSFFWRPVELAIKPYAWKASAYWSKVDLPLAKGTTAGAFSIAHTQDLNLLGFRRPALFTRMVIVGGNFQKPEQSLGTAVFTIDGGEAWYAAHTPPHGYRSAVAYATATKTWITVGPNGTDISTDDGSNWRALRPNPALPEPADADQHWNALSLPFVVGPHGRIGKLRPDALIPVRP